MYTRQFFQAFAALGLFMTCVSLQYLFAKYLEFRGCDVATGGMITAVGMIGPLLIRIHLGQCIDRFGFRLTWMSGTLAVAVALGVMPFVAGLLLITGLRAVFQMAVSAVMTTVAVFAAQIAPPHRRAESIGTIGLAGFMGTSLGPLLGEWIFSGGDGSIDAFRLFFWASVACSLGSCAVMLSIRQPAAAPFAPARWPAADPAGGQTLSTFRVIRRYWPGAILLVSLVFSMAFSLNTFYLERLAQAAGFEKTRLFYIIYCPTAMVMRLVFRRLPERFGRRGTLLFGMALHAGGLLSLLGVGSEAHLILPAVLMGAGHCFIFPSMVDLAADRLPPQYRGTGTAVVFAAGDLGLLLGYALLGRIIAVWGYDAAVAFLAGAMVFGAVVYALADGADRGGRR